MSEAVVNWRWSLQGVNKTVAGGDLPNWRKRLDSSGSCHSPRLTSSGCNVGGEPQGRGSIIQGEPWDVELLGEGVFSDLPGERRCTSVLSFKGTVLVSAIPAVSIFWRIVCLTWRSIHHLSSSSSSGIWRCFFDPSCTWLLLESSSSWTRSCLLLFRTCLRSRSWAEGAWLCLGGGLEAWLHLGGDSEPFSSPRADV
ncbi:hypothetical protein AAC387_Pa10g0512 [Persea americana]